MIETLPPPTMKELLRSSAKKVSYDRVRLSVNALDLTHWEKLNKLSYQLVIAEHKLKEIKLIDFLIPSYRDFIRSLAKWKTRTFPLLEGLIEELTFFHQFMEAGEKLQWKKNAVVVDQDLRLRNLEKFERSFVSSLGVNRAEIEKELYEAAIFTEKFQLLLKHSRHYFDKNIDNEIVQNELLENITADKLEHEKRGQLKKYMTIIADIRQVSEQIEPPITFFRQVTASIVLMGEYITAASDKKAPRADMEEILSKWKALNAHATVYVQKIK